MKRMILNGSRDAHTFDERNRGHTNEDAPMSQVRIIISASQRERRHP